MVPSPSRRRLEEQRSVSAVDRMEAFLPRAVLDETRNLGTTLRHAIDGEGSVRGIGHDP